MTPELTEAIRRALLAAAYWSVGFAGPVGTVDDARRLMERMSQAGLDWSTEYERLQLAIVSAVQGGVGK